MRWNGLPVVIFGSGGISKETFHIVEQINDTNNFKVYDFLGFIENSESKVGTEVINGYRVISCDDDFYKFAKDFLVLGVIIPNGIPKIKASIYNKISSIDNLVFPNVIHPSVNFDIKTVVFGCGNIVASGTSLTCNIEIGNFNLINLNSTIGHDTKIGNFNVINPITSISGNVNIEDLCLIGTGANVLQQITIKNNATIGAGAVVIKDVKDFDTVVGIPARTIEIKNK